MKTVLQKQNILEFDQDMPNEPLENIAIPADVRQAALDLIQDGVHVVRGAATKDLCQSIIDDYNKYTEQNHAYVQKNLDDSGHEKRLVNFHFWSDAAAQLGANPKIMSILDFVFGSKASIYTSLTFKYGSQQPTHRDTPHFATWPRRMFVGAWTALEDVSLDAGPLFYHPKAHNFKVDPAAMFNQALERDPQAKHEDILKTALDLYNGEIIRRAHDITPPQILEMKAGDTVIWHPEAPHGGTPARNANLTRWSMVFHCAPEDVQVHQHDRFFTHYKDTPPPDRYGYTERFGRKFALTGEVLYM